MSEIVLTWWLLVSVHFIFPTNFQVVSISGPYVSKEACLRFADRSVPPLPVVDGISTLQKSCVVDDSISGVVGGLIEQSKKEK